MGMLQIQHTGQTSMELIEEKKFRSFARRRIKEGKLTKISKFDFRYVQLERRVELVEEMVFMCFAIRYSKEGKLALIHDFEFPYIPLKRRLELLQAYSSERVPPVDDQEENIESS